MPDVGVVCASGSLGLTPLHPESYWAAVQAKPSAIAADAGSGDIGPHYLGSGLEYNSREWEKHDLRLMLLAARQLRVPMIVGSAGGSGSNAGVDRYVEIVREIAREESLSGFRLASIYSEVDQSYLAARARSEDIRGLGAPSSLTPEDVEECSRVVAMMGVEPLVVALEKGADVIIAGRSCDDAVFAATPIYLGMDRGLSLHMGKTIECGPLVATPILQREAVMGTVRESDFLVEAFHPDQRCTPTSVAGHTLYERADTYRHELPGGAVDLTDVRFDAYTDRICRVSGSQWVPADEYRLKLEGASFVGHRAYVILGLRDPISIRNVDAIADSIRVEVIRQCGPLDVANQLFFHIYGKDAVMGNREPTPVITSHEICVVIEAFAPTEEQAVHMAKVAKYSAFRANYPGKVSTAGGAALLADEVLKAPIPSYRWRIDHLLPVADPLDLFPMEFADL